MADDPGKNSNLDEYIPEPYSREDFSLRPNVGARNPVALAIHKDKKHGDAERGHIHPKSILKSAFNEKYEEFFDPKHGSNLFHGISKKTKEWCDSCQISHGDLKKIVEQYERKEASPPPFCSGAGMTASLQEKIDGNVPAYRITPPGSKNYGLEFNDPVQGCVADCWFIAALSSVAWVEQNTALRTARLSRVAGQSWFYPQVPELDSSGKPTGRYLRPKKVISTANTFYLDSSGDPYFARTHPFYVSQDQYECWTSFYEKCCTGYLKQQKVPEFNSVSDPDYSILNYNDAFEALSDLTGVQYTRATVKNTVDYLIAQDSTALAEVIRQNVCYTGWTETVSPPLPQFLYTKRPTVAYTYFSDYFANIAIGKANSALKNTAYEGIKYNCMGVSANHVYSVLGLYREAGRIFVVLRNPWGFAGDRDSFNDDLKDRLAGEGLNTALKNLNFIRTFRGSPADEGIFGIRSEDFMRYFETFGWVPTPL